MRGCHSDFAVHMVIKSMFLQLLSKIHLCYLRISFENTQPRPWDISNDYSHVQGTKIPLPKTFPNASGEPYPKLYIAFYIATSPTYFKHYMYLNHHTYKSKTKRFLRLICKLNSPQQFYNLIL